MRVCAVARKAGMVLGNRQSGPTESVSSFGDRATGPFEDIYLEREFIEKRMADEQTALDALVAETFPATFPLPKDSSSSSSSSMGAAS